MLVMGHCGKIGNGAPILIGNKGTLIVKSSGWLFLADNDNLNWYFDNQGGYSVTLNI